MNLALPKLSEDSKSEIKTFMSPKKENHKKKALVIKQIKNCLIFFSNIYLGFLLFIATLYENIILPLNLCFQSFNFKHSMTLTIFEFIVTGVFVLKF